jgi:hypothetical protein
VNVAVCPVATVWLAGCVVIAAMAPCTASDPDEELPPPHAATPNAATATTTHPKNNPNFNPIVGTNF